MQRGREQSLSTPFFFATARVGRDGGLSDQEDRVGIGLRHELLGAPELGPLIRQRTIPTLM